ncbi:hypothetical protein BC793_104511 [Actinoplanes xinjiangensis]|uniref:Uncharacterized protein n=1 Tax=Actinoplanes xinjiangensis TaxID=512350 RepID=A0A316FM85_9ACTN|nr:hypothetical protein BC793_104511 [Actinoplanes xinjiangensis]
MSPILRTPSWIFVRPAVRRMPLVSLILPALSVPPTLALRVILFRCLLRILMRWSPLLRVLK